MQTRSGFLKGLAVFGAGAGLAGDSMAQESVAQTFAIPLDWRFGRVDPPRLSISLPRSWFLTERLTDIGDPLQLFAIANRTIPAPHRNVAGTVNVGLIPPDAVLVTAVAFEITPDMAVWAKRTSSPPPRLSLSGMSGGQPLGDRGLKFYSWAYFGQTFGIQVFVWVGDRAPLDDQATLGAVIASLTFDQPL
jgi:hypothetical protein